jgi:hypothetical protein
LLGSPREAWKDVKGIDGLPSVLKQLTVREMVVSIIELELY